MTIYDRAKTVSAEANKGNDEELKRFLIVLFDKYQKNVIEIECLMNAAGLNDLAKVPQYIEEWQLEDFWTG